MSPTIWVGLAAVLALGPDPVASARMFVREGERAFKSAAYPRATVLLEKAVHLDPRNVHARFALADALALQGQYARAAAQLGEGIKLDPRWPERDYSRYGQFRSPKELDDFVKRLDAECLRGVGPDACLVFAYNAFHLNDKESASRAFGEVLKARPRDALARRYRRALVARGGWKSTPSSGGSPVPAGKGGSPASPDKGGSSAPSPSPGPPSGDEHPAKK